MILLSAKSTFDSLSTAWFLATAASIAARFSGATSSLRSSVAARVLVTSASDETLSSADLASERAFSVGVAFLSASSFATLSLSACSFSNPSLFDSVTTVPNAERISFWTFTSSFLAASFAKTDLAVAKASRALATTEASAYLAFDNAVSKFEILVSRRDLFTLTSSFLGVSVVFSANWILLPPNSGEEFSTFWIFSLESETGFCSVAETAPFPKNIKPAAIATDAAPKLYLRIP